MCHHDLWGKRLNQIYNYGGKLHCAVSLLCNEWEFYEDMASECVYHHDSTRYQQKLFGKRPQHAKVLPMGDQDTYWNSVH